MKVDENIVKEKNVSVYFTADEVTEILREIISKKYPILRDDTVKVYVSGFERDHRGGDSDIRFHWTEEEL